MIQYKIKKDNKRSSYIRENLNRVLAEMRDEYIEIIQKIRALNKDAQIILMTQYYPSASQNNYGIYPFMKEVGEILNLGGMSHNPMTVIHEIMKMTYSDVLKRVPHENIVVADITPPLTRLIIKTMLVKLSLAVLAARRLQVCLNM